MTIVWYIMIHVSLGLIGKDYFSFTNLGAIYCMLACSIIQGYATWEIHRIAWPMFESSVVHEFGPQQISKARRGYWNRLGRTFVFRVSAFSILTLLIAAMVRGTGN